MSEHTGDRTQPLMQIAIMAIEGGVRLKQELESGQLFIKPITEYDQADVHALCLTGGLVSQLGMHAPWLAAAKAALAANIGEPTPQITLRSIVDSLGPLNPAAAGVNDYHIARCFILDFPAVSVAYIRSRLNGRAGSRDQRGTIHWAINSLINQHPGTKWGKLFGGLVDREGIQARALGTALGPLDELLDELGRMQ